MLDYISLEKFTKDLTVLFVEDDILVQKETTELLSELFDIVITSNNGEEALFEYKQFYNCNKKYFDIVISDVKMPKVDGLELSKAIYEINKEQEIIIISAYSEINDLIGFINIGISQFITKPIEINQFLEIIYQISEKIYLLKDSFDENNEIIKLTNSISWVKENKTISKNNQNLKLTKKETLLFELLLSKKDKIFLIDEIIDYLWEDGVADITNLKNIISRLRKKLPEISIENIYGLGYKIIYC